MNRLFTVIVAGLLSATMFLLPGCGNNTAADNKPTVAVSILPQEYFVSRIAGDLFNINVMIPPGASPATYEPTPAQLTSLSKTNLYLKIGYTGFEMAWMDKLASASKTMKIVNTSEGVDLITEATIQGEAHHSSEEHSTEEAHGHHHGGVDPHTWLSPKNVKIIAKNIHDALATAYPEHQQPMAENLAFFLRDLDSLDNGILNELQDLSSRAFFTYHPSLSYFARDYQLEQVPLELGGKTPSAAHMKKLIDLGKQEKIGVVFLQMQFDQKNAEVLAKEIGAEIVQINPLDPEWIEQMLFITEKLKENLQ